MTVNQKIQSFTPEQFAIFINGLDNFDINLSVTIKPQSDDMTTNQVVEFFGISKQHLYKLTLENTIPFKKNGGKRCYSRKALEELRADGIF